MIHHVKKAFHKPHLLIPATLAVALILGIFAFVKFEKRRVALAPDANAVLGDTTTVPGGNQDITLAFPKGGRVNSVPVKVGDKVTKGQVLASLDSQDASGALSQAKGVLLQAQANYNRVVNGATGPDIDVAKQVVQSATTNLANVTKTQAVAVENAHNTLLNSTIQAIPGYGTTDYTPPTITGSYTLGVEGQIIIDINGKYNLNNQSFTLSGVTTGSGNINATAPQALGNSGLFITFPDPATLTISQWVINLPNTRAPNYIANYNAYQSALQMQTQTVASAQATLDQANAALALKVAGARPEDVAQAKAQVESATGAVQTAQGAYANDFIYAPADGTITLVDIHSGEIAIMNGKAISMTTLPTNN